MNTQFRGHQINVIKLRFRAKTQRRNFQFFNQGLVYLKQSRKENPVNLMTLTIRSQIQPAYASRFF